MSQISSFLNKHGAFSSKKNRYLYKYFRLKKLYLIRERCKNVIHQKKEKNGERSYQKT